MGGGVTSLREGQRGALHAAPERRAGAGNVVLSKAWAESLWLRPRAVFFRRGNPEVASLTKPRRRPQPERPDPCSKPDSCQSSGPSVKTRARRAGLGQCAKSVGIMRAKAHAGGAFAPGTRDGMRQRGSGSAGPRCARGLSLVCIHCAALAGRSSGRRKTPQAVRALRTGSHSRAVHAVAVAAGHHDGAGAGAT